MSSKRPSKTLFVKIAVTVLWAAIWQIAAVLIGNNLVLVGPVQALTALGAMMIHGSFWQSVWGSLYRIMLGFLTAAITAICLSTLSYKVKLVKEFLSLPMTIFKTVPVASFIILMLISLRSKEGLSSIICFMMSLPVMYANTLSGLYSIDPKMLEMAQVFGVSRSKKFIYLYTYRVLPFFATGAKIALGLSWKAGVAAELIGLVQNTIGNELYSAKLYLMMDQVFAWTAVIVVLSIALEFLTLGALRLLQRRLEQ
jgi:NitT/TauT family transport system permease protein